MAAWSTTELVPAGVIGGPTGLAFSPSGDLYVADYYNQVWKVAGGTASVFAGSDATLGHTDGTGAAASFTHPYCVACDASGNVYVGEWAEVRKITPAGVVTTVAGSPSASFFPRGMVCDASGNLYVVDNTPSILKITPAGVVTTLASVSGGALDTIAYDTDSGDLFVADTAARDLMRVTMAGVVTSVATLDVGYVDPASGFQPPECTFAAFDRFGVLSIAVVNYDSGSRILRYSPLTAAWLEPATLDLPFNTERGVLEQVYGFACSDLTDVISYQFGTQISTLVRSTSRLHTVGGHFRSAGGAQINMMQRAGIGPWLPIEDL
jgi:hypothetical protein